MAGTVIGGKKAAAKNLARDPNFYRKIGRMGGSVKGTQGGFASDNPCECDTLKFAHDKRQCAGFKGGTISRRGKKKES